MSSHFFKVTELCIYLFSNFAISTKETFITPMFNALRLQAKIDIWFTIMCHDIDLKLIKTNLTDNLSKLL